MVWRVSCSISPSFNVSSNDVSSGIRTLPGVIVPSVGAAVGGVILGMPGTACLDTNGTATMMLPVAGARTLGSSGWTVKLTTLPVCVNDAAYTVADNVGFTPGGVTGDASVGIRSVGCVPLAKASGAAPSWITSLPGSAAVGARNRIGSAVVPSAIA